MVHANAKAYFCAWLFVEMLSFNKLLFWLMFTVTVANAVVADHNDVVANVFAVTCG